MKSWFFEKYYKLLDRLTKRKNIQIIEIKY